MTLTESGIELAGTLVRLFQELHRKVDAIREAEGQSVIRISTTHSFAMKWLIPSIQSFTRDHPEYDVRIEANDKVVRVGEDCHVALRFTPEEAGASAGKLLFDDILVAAYNPALVPASAGATIPVDACFASHCFTREHRKHGSSCSRPTVSGVAGSTLHAITVTRDSWCRQPSLAMALPWFRFRWHATTLHRNGLW